MTNTTNYELQLFEGSDKFDYKVINKNAVKIDEKIKEIVDCNTIDECTIALNENSEIIWISTADRFSVQEFTQKVPDGITFILGKSVTVVYSLAFAGHEKVANIYTYSKDIASSISEDIRDGATVTVIEKYNYLEPLLKTIANGGFGNSLTDDQIATALETYLAENPIEGVGEKGEDGLSAYEVAVNNGYEGTEKEWLESLKGTNGENGSDGTDGVSVTNAYILGAEAGTEAGKLVIEFSNDEGLILDKVVGTDGVDGKDGADGYTPVKGIDYFTEAEKAEMVEEVTAQFNSDGIPTYWQEHIADKIATIKALQSAGGKDAFSFVLITDMHAEQNLGGNSGLLAKKIMDECHIPYALVIGDIVTRNAVSTEAEMDESFDLAHSILKPIINKTLMAQGNHDGCWGSGYTENYTPQKVYDKIYRSVGTVGNATFDESGTAYYIDDTAGRVRYIMLNPHTRYGAENAGLNMFNHYRFTQTQFDLVIEALTSIPRNDWGVVVSTHIPPVGWVDRHSDGTYEGSIADLMPDRILMRNLLKAYREKTTFSGNFGTSGNWDYVNVNVDFTNAKGEFVAWFAGHLHTDLDYPATAYEILDSNGTIGDKYGIPIICTRCDSKNENTYGANGTDTDEALLNERVAGTITEQSFDVFTVNKAESKIYATKIGAGNDRIIGITDPVETFSVTTNLTNATVSNKATIVTENSAFTSIVSANNGYEIETVTVIMGGTDITSTAYNDGTINIETVTGDIVITVTTIEAVEEATNYFDASTATLNVRLSSSGSTSDYKGMVVTAPIYYDATTMEGKTFRVSGIEQVKSSAYGYNARIVYYDSAGVKVSEYNDSDFSSFSTTESGGIPLTYGDFTGNGYLRIALVVKDNVAITEADVASLKITLK